MHLVRHFPLSEHYRAFDLVVAAAGYNSFHESLRLGVPTLLVPNRHTSLDDQEARARAAAAAGRSAPPRSRQARPGRVDELLSRGEQLVAAARGADPGNGAQAAADHIASLADRGNR